VMKFSTVGPYRELSISDYTSVLVDSGYASALAYLYESARRMREDDGGNLGCRLACATTRVLLHEGSERCLQFWAWRPITDNTGNYLSNFLTLLSGGCIVLLFCSTFVHLYSFSFIIIQ
jgi:hypothetical protein